MFGGVGMIPTIKAIETVYNGYKFRSRLEARWAVFFDTAGIRYEYEKEGFDLGKLGWYLPDFWLPDLECWIEVKPDYEDAINDGHTRCLRLAQITQQRALLVYGNPWPDDYMIVDCPPYDPFVQDFEQAWPFCEAAWAECRKCDGWWIREHDNGALTLGQHTCDEGFNWPLMGEMSSKLMQAYTAARQARFEHGRRG